jgi:F-type H+-transporting ATPase subunit delta
MTAANDKPEQYALALLALARANNAVEDVRKDLSHLVGFVRANAAVRQFLDAGDVTTPGKQHALAGLLGGRIHPLLVQFALLLAATGDIGLLGEIATACTAAGADQQTTTGEIQSAVPLSADRIRAIEEEIAIRLGHPVHLEPRVMNNILGGIRVKVGDVVIDGTLDTQLEDARLLLNAAVYPQDAPVAPPSRNL